MSKDAFTLLGLRFSQKYTVSAMLVVLCVFVMGLSHIDGTPISGCAASLIVGGTETDTCKNVGGGCNSLGDRESIALQCNAGW